MSLPKSRVHERLCSECALPKSDSFPRSFCKACPVCKRLYCVQHLRKHFQRRGVQKKQLTPCEAQLQCSTALPSVTVKGAPKSISNDDALCAYAAVLQCIASCFPSAVITECTSIMRQSKHAETAPSMVYGNVVAAQVNGLLACLRSLQSTDKNPLEIPEALMLRILPSASSTRAQPLEAVGLDASLNFAMHSKREMRDAASVFCDFAFLSHNLACEKLEVSTEKAVQNIQRVLFGKVRGREFHMLSFPADLWLLHEKRARACKADVSRSRTLCDIIFDVLGISESLSGEEALCQKLSLMSTDPAEDLWPSNLIIHFERTVSTQAGQHNSVQKVCTNFALPFLFHPCGNERAPSDTHIGSNLTITNKRPCFALTAVLVHEGDTAKDGHFTSFILRRGRWYFCSDTSYSACSEDAVDNAAAYMAFYCAL